MRLPARHIGIGIILGTVLALPIPAVAQSPSPDAALSPSPTEDAALGDALALVELLNEVPAGIRASCGPSTVQLEGVATSAQCLYQQGVQEGVVLYVRFGDEADLHAGYDYLASLTGLAPDTGTACRDGAFEGEYTAADGAAAGRLVCQVDTDGPVAAWIDGPRLVLGVVQLTGETTFVALEEAWLSARLDAAPVAAPATAGPTLAPVAGSAIDQWASDATASSEYGENSWSAGQATGASDTTSYGDYSTAWAPDVLDGGIEWIELTYDVAVIPERVTVWETSGNGFVTLIEAWDDASGGWLTLWQGTDDSPAAVHGFSPPLEPIEAATRRVRISVDTAIGGWNEIDAVELSGVVPG